MVVLTRTSKHAELIDAYERIKAVVARNRLKDRVHLPRLMGRGSRYTVSGLMLIFFYINLGQVRTIAELKAFLVTHGCRSMNPQPRHLGMQHGFRFLVQNCVHPRMAIPLRQGQYCLLDLTSVHPSAVFHHRDRPTTLTAPRFRGLCVRYDHRCAVCGSRDGEPHYKNSLLRTTLERGHADPRRPLTLRNCIPMCRLCNCAYKDKVAFNLRGIVVRWLK